MVENAAKPLLGSPPIVRSSDMKVWKRFNQNHDLGPVVIAVKEGEFANKLSIGRITPESLIVKWLDDNKQPIADELTTENFQSVMRSSSNSLVVLVAIDTSKLTDADLQQQQIKLKEMSKLWSVNGQNVKGRSVIFVWMDGVKWAKWLGNMYGVKLADMPSVIVADHQVSLFLHFALTMADGSRCRIWCFMTTPQARKGYALRISR